MRSIILFALLGLTAAKPLAVVKLTLQHFASEDANKAASFDLTPWGYHGFQLPKAYDLTSGNMTYLPDRSYNVFLSIIAGNKNNTSSAPPIPSALIDERADNVEEAAIEARACNGIDMELSADSCGYGYSSSCVDSATCWYSNCGTVHEIIVYYVQNVYVTFWTSQACNGKKGSFNPVCGTSATQNCYLNRNFNSWRIYSGCHHQYSNDGCQ